MAGFAIVWEGISELWYCLLSDSHAIAAVVSQRDSRFRSLWSHWRTVGQSFCKIRLENPFVVVLGSHRSRLSLLPEYRRRDHQHRHVFRVAQSCHTSLRQLGLARCDRAPAAEER